MFFVCCRRVVFALWPCGQYMEFAVFCMQGGLPTLVSTLFTLVTDPVRWRCSHLLPVLRQEILATPKRKLPEGYEDAHCINRLNEHVFVCWRSLCELKSLLIGSGQGREECASSQRRRGRTDWAGKHASSNSRRSLRSQASLDASVGSRHTHGLHNRDPEEAFDWMGRTAAMEVSHDTTPEEHDAQLRLQQVSDI